MIYSMTGYGKASHVFENINISVEIKSLNSRYLDINLRLPNKYKSQELKLRKIIKDKVHRGKVDVTITTEGASNNQNYALNRDVIKAYYKELTSISNDLELDTMDAMTVIMRLPDVTRQDTTSCSEEELEILEKTIKDAADAFIAFRTSEGNALKEDLLSHNVNIINHLVSLEKVAPTRAERLRQKIWDSLQESLGAEKVDTNRFEQELIYYLEKLDINEEVVRLRSHCQYFEKELNTTNATTKGKKLGFICQEIGREINTIGAKANNAQIQEFVVQMKDALEKMKEQVMNIM